MKNTTNKDYTALKRISGQINSLIERGEWNALPSEQKKDLVTYLRSCASKFNGVFSKRRLARVLGAAFLLLSGSVSAQTFAPRVEMPFNIENTGSFIHKPDFADLDNDGDLDLITSNLYGGKLVYQENIGTATEPNFADSSMTKFDGIGEGYFLNPVLADIDNDGDLDLFMTNYEYGVIHFSENVGTAEEPEFSESVADPFGMTSYYNFLSAIVDIDDDGDLDLIASGYDYEDETGNIIFIENTGTAEEPAFAEGVGNPFGTNFSNEYFSFVDFADLDDDGDYDMMRALYYGQDIYYHENEGSASEPEFFAGDGATNPFGIEGFTGDEYTAAVTFADIDDDGDYDLFVAEYYGRTFFYENISVTAGIDEETNDKSLSLSPNPTTGLLNLATDLDLNAIAEVRIYTVDGQEVLLRTNQFNNTIDVSELDNGVYIMVIRSTEGDIAQSKFVKK